MVGHRSVKPTDSHPTRFDALKWYHLISSLQCSLKRLISYGISGVFVSIGGIPRPVWVIMLVRGKNTTPGDLMSDDEFIKTFKLFAHVNCYSNAPLSSLVAAATSQQTAGTRPTQCFMNIDTYARITITALDALVNDTVVGSVALPRVASAVCLSFDLLEKLFENAAQYNAKQAIVSTDSALTVAMPMVTGFKVYCSITMNCGNNNTHEERHNNCITFNPFHSNILELAGGDVDLQAALSEVQLV